MNKKVLNTEGEKKDKKEYLFAPFEEVFFEAGDTLFCQ